MQFGLNKCVVKNDNFKPNYIISMQHSCSSSCSSLVWINNPWFCYFVKLHLVCTSRVIHQHEKWLWTLVEANWQRRCYWSSGSLRIHLLCFLQKLKTSMNNSLFCSWLLIVFLDLWFNRGNGRIVIVCFVNCWEKINSSLCQSTNCLLPGNRQRIIFVRANNMN